MRLDRRLARLEAARLTCDGRVTHIIGPDEPIDDVCPRCGECHVLVIEEVVVDAVDGGNPRCV